MENENIQNQESAFSKSLENLSTSDIAPKLPRKYFPLSSLLIRGIVVLLLVAVMIACIREITDSLMGYKEAGDIYSDLSNMMGSVMSTSSAVKRANKDFYSGTTQNYGISTVPNLPSASDTQVSEALILVRQKLASLRKINPDVIGWIEIPGTVINYPVVQTTDNDYYLDHSINGTYLKSGSIFVDYQNGSKWGDPNTIIYGHNMASGEMFAQLAKYKGGTFFRANPYIYVQTDEGIYVYTIFSAYETNIYNPYTRMKFSSENDFVEWAKTALSSSLKKHYNKTFEFDRYDKIITLSTCTNGFGEDGRLAVHAVLTDIIK